MVGFAVSDAFEIIFDTLDSTRKVANLRVNPRIALVIGGLDAGDERTVHYEGIADEPSGPELERLTEIYYHVYPDGRTHRSWPGLIYIRVKPTWIRYSDYTKIRLKSPNSMRKPCSRPNQSLESAAADVVKG